MKDNPFLYLSFVMQYSCTNLDYELKWDSAEKRDVQQLKNKKLNRPSIVKNTLMLFFSLHLLLPAAITIALHPVFTKQTKILIANILGNYMIPNLTSRLHCVI